MDVILVLLEERLCTLVSILDVDLAMKFAAAETEMKRRAFQV